MRYDNPNHSYHYKYQLAVTRITTVLITLTLFLGFCAPWIATINVPGITVFLVSIIAFLIIYGCVFCIFNIEKFVCKVIYITLVIVADILYSVISYLTGDK